MKNIVKLLALMLVVLLAVGVLVACDGDKPDAGNTPGTGDTPATPDEPGKDDPDPDPDPDPKPEPDNGRQFNVTFKFVDSEGNELAPDVVRKNVKRGNKAYAPNGYINAVDRFEDYVVTGWDSNGDGVADEEFNSVTRTMTVVALLRPKIQCEVSFYRMDGTTPIEGGVITVKEGTQITDEMLAEYFDIPVEMGKYFKNWTLLSLESSSDISCIRDDCSFKPVYGDTQGVIPMVDTEVKVDGRWDSVYDNAAFLPLNNKRQAEGTAQLEDDPAFIASPDVANRYKTNTTGGAYLVWDGDYVYIMIEVSDKTLSARNAFYVQAIENSYMNDAVEVFYTFEQTTGAARNNTKVGIDAAGQKLYSIDRSRGIGGGRSTHYGEITAATDCALNGVAADLEARGLYKSGYDAEGNEAPSYRVEIKIPAKTEGVADKANYPEIDEATGFIGGTVEDYANEAAYKAALRNEDNYKFTEGSKLKAGSFFRLSLQVCDLMVDQDTLADKNSACHEDSTIDPVNDPAYKGDKYAASHYLYNAAGKGVYPKFAAVAQTQYETKYYVTFSLGDTNESLTTVWDFSEDQKFLDAEGNDITPEDD